MGFALRSSHPGLQRRGEEPPRPHQEAPGQHLRQGTPEVVLCQQEPRGLLSLGAFPAAPGAGSRVSLPVASRWALAASWKKQDLAAGWAKPAWRVPSLHLENTFKSLNSKLILKGPNLRSPGAHGVSAAPARLSFSGSAPWCSRP